MVKPLPVSKSSNADASNGSTVSTTYEASDDKVDMIYYATVRKGSDAFWMINCSGLLEEQEMRIPQFELWGSTISVQ